MASPAWPKSGLEPAAVIHPENVPVLARGKYTAMRTTKCHHNASCTATHSSACPSVSTSLPLVASTTWSSLDALAQQSSWHRHLRRIIAHVEAQDLDPTSVCSVSPACPAATFTALVHASHKGRSSDRCGACYRMRQRHTQAAPNRHNGVQLQA